MMIDIWTEITIENYVLGLSLIVFEFIAVMLAFIIGIFLFASNKKELLTNFKNSFYFMNEYNINFTRKDEEIEKTKRK